MPNSDTFRQLAEPPPTPVEPVTQVLQGVTVTDPYCWLENQSSPRTRRWLREQTRYARTYLDNIPGRERIRKRIQELLSIETYDSVHKVGNRYFFRKRAAHQAQPCIYMREGPDGEDQLLVDPATRGTGPYTAVNIVCVSPGGKFLAYGVNERGSLGQSIEVLDIERRERLPDGLPRGFAGSSFVFAPDNESFYYVHRPIDAEQRCSCTAYQHVLGNAPQEDREIFCAGEDSNIDLQITADETHLGFLVWQPGTDWKCDFYLQPFGSRKPPQLVAQCLQGVLFPILFKGRVFALTDHNAPNWRVVEIRAGGTGDLSWSEVVPETNSQIESVIVASDRIFVSYLEDSRKRIDVYDLSGNKKGELVFKHDETVRVLSERFGSDEFLYEVESFTQPPAVYRYVPERSQQVLWSKKEASFDPSHYASRQVRYSSKDGTSVPMFLVGRRDVLNANEIKPTILAGYCGFCASMTPRFGVLVNFLIEHGCLFALADLRGGAEFGEEWQPAAKSHNRQEAYDDFISAAEWLVENGYTTPEKLAIFGGPNSGLLVGAVSTQRPDLFRAVLCLEPLLEMLRYHPFDSAASFQDEPGIAENLDGHVVLPAYSPYREVRSGVAYPATLMASDDRDEQCNPLHACKMTARLQTANISQNPILLDYKQLHRRSAVLALSERIESLTDRLAFVCDQLGLAV